jgi:hypothetical protein
MATGFWLTVSGHAAAAGKAPSARSSGPGTCAKCRLAEMVFARSETLVGFLRALREGITDGVALGSDEGPIGGGTWETHYACVWREGCGTQPRDHPPGGVATFDCERSKVLKSVPGRCGRYLSREFARRANSAICGNLTGRAGGCQEPPSSYGPPRSIAAWYAGLACSRRIQSSMFG